MSHPQKKISKDMNMNINVDVMIIQETKLLVDNIENIIRYIWKDEIFHVVPTISRSRGILTAWDSSKYIDNLYRVVLASCSSPY